MTDRSSSSSDLGGRLEAAEHAYGPGVEMRGSFHCRACGEFLGWPDEGYEAKSVIVSKGLGSAGPLVAADERFRFYVFLCPHCGQCLKTTVSRIPEPWSPDVVLNHPSGQNG